MTEREYRVERIKGVVLWAIWIAIALVLIYLYIKSGIWHSDGGGGEPPCSRGEC
jgi:hypothetical protein